MKRTVLVTGASRGIGAAVRDGLLADGHQVIGVAREPGAAREGYYPVGLDLSDLESLPAHVDGILREHPAIDAVISNAGGPAFGSLEEFSPGDITRRIELNLTSHVLVARQLIPHLKRQGRGDLVFMGSEASLKGGRRGSIYCAAKFGLRGFALSLREECSTAGVRVSIILPGMVRTSFFDDLDFEPGEHPENAIPAEEVAAAVRRVLEADPSVVFDEIIISPLKRVVRMRGKEAR